MNVKGKFQRLRASIVTIACIAPASFAFGDQTLCTEVMKDAVGFISKVHLGEDATNTFVYVGEPEFKSEDFGTSLYQVVSSLPGRDELKFEISINNRTCRVSALSIVETE